MTEGNGLADAYYFNIHAFSGTLNTNEYKHLNNINHEKSRK